MQGDDNWKALRRGLLTASRFADLMAMTKSGPSTSHANLIARLACERFTGNVMEGYQNAAMLRGIEMEAEARLAYEDDQLVVVEKIDYVQHPTLWFVSCSPDGLVGDVGLVEFKCPTAEDKHLLALKFGQHAIEYKWQLQGQLWICEKEWDDATSYHPGFGSRALAIKRVYRDEKEIAKLEAACITANDEIEEQVNWLKEGA